MLSGDFRLARRTPVARRPIRPALGRLLALLVAAVPGAAWGQGLTADERRVAEVVDGFGEGPIEFLDRVVRIDSPTQDLDGVKEVGNVFRAELDRLGFETSWEAMPPEMRRAGHLVAERKGSAGKKLLLIGHLDTVLPGGTFDRKGTRATGSGALDMKGGDVVILYALKALHAAGALEGRRIIVVLHGDEEDAGMPIEKSRATLLGAARRSDVALAFENAVDDTATVARRGASTWRLTVTARTGHSSGIMGEGAGAGAIFEASRILDEVRRELPEKYLTINPSVVVGGTTAQYNDAAKSGSAEGKTNVIPGRVVVEGDLRFISEGQKERAREAMRRIVARHLPKAEATITFGDEYPAMAPTEGNYRILAELDRASRDLGLGGIKALDPGKRGAGDVSFVASLVDGLDGLGVRGAGAHAPDEWVDLDSLLPQIKRAALLIDRLSRP